MSGLSQGSTIAGCRLEAVAGRGGMGVVYRATQLALDRPVALKAIAPQYAQDAAYRERFQRESHIAASIDHPNVIPVHEAGELDGTLYLIMRWVDGTDLRALLASGGRLPPARALQLLRPVASALAAAHRRGLVHRDIKPANVLIATGADDEHVYLTDFGIARRTDGEAAMTRPGVLVGTLDYTAPERIEGGMGDAASDIYSFGCMLFEALTGRVPFDRPTELAMMYAHLNDPVPEVRASVPDVPVALDELIAKAMAKRPQERFPSATALGGALDEVIGGLASGKPPAPTVETVQTPVVTETEAAREAKLAAVPTHVTASGRVHTDVDDRPATAVTGHQPGRRRALIPLAGLALAGVVVAVVLSSGGGGGATHPSDVSSISGAGLAAGRMVSLGGAPGYVSAGSPDVWVSIPAREAIVQIDPAGGPPRTFPVGGHPGAIAAGAGGIWVSSSGAGPLARFSPQTGGPLATAANLRGVPVALAVNGSDGSVWEADSSGAVTHIGVDGSLIGKPTVVSSAPTAIGWGEGWVWAVNGSATGLIRVDPGANGEQRTFDTGPAPVGVAFDSGVWTAHSSGDVTRFDPRTGYLAVNTTRHVASELDAIAAGESQPSVWAISSQTKRLYRISTAKGAPVTGTVAFTSPPVALAVGADGTAWVATSDGAITPIHG